MYWGILVTIIIFFWMIIEIIILMGINWNFSFKKFGEDEDIESESRAYGTRALRLGGLTFAAISLLIGTSEDLHSVKNTLVVLVFGFCLLLSSYKIEVLTNKNRIYWKLQEKCLNFGYLTLIFALLVFFYEKAVYIIFNVIVVFIIAIIILHIGEFVLNDCKLYFDMKNEKHIETKST